MGTTCVETFAKQAPDRKRNPFHGLMPGIKSIEVASEMVVVSGDTHTHTHTHWRRDVCGPCSGCQESRMRSLPACLFMCVRVSVYVCVCVCTTDHQVFLGG